MKLIKIIGHPVVVIIMFFLVIISGKSFGGFYLMYILMGLTYGVTHSIIAVLALTVMLVGYRINVKKAKIVKPLIYVIGCALMILALLIFFQQSKGYNDSTFHQTIPVISLILFGLSVFCNLLLAITLIFNSGNKNVRHLNIAS